jgi:hypothetical protein
MDFRDAVYTVRVICNIAKKQHPNEPSKITVLGKQSADYIWAAKTGLFLLPGDDQAGLLVGFDITDPIQDAAHHLDIRWSDLL